MPNLLVLFQDPANKVRECLAWLMGKIAEHHPLVYDDAAFANEIFPRLIKMNDDKPRVAR